MFLTIVDYYIDSVLNDTVFVLYLVTLLVDILTGNAVAMYHRKWNSKVGINGTIRHLALLVVMVLLLPMITYVTEISIVANGVMFYVIAQYTISILENLSAMGIDIYDGFGKYFEFLGKHSSDFDKQNNKGRKNEDE